MMRRRVRVRVAVLATALFLGLAFGSSGCLLSRRPAPPSSPAAGVWPIDDRALAEHVPGQVVVRLRPGADIGTVAKSVGAQPLKELRRLNAWLLTVPPGQQVGVIANRLAATPGVRYAEPNHIYRTTSFPLSGSPSDTYYALQSQALGQIHATGGWQALAGAPVNDPLGDGDPDVVIAVIDTGVDPDHPDFSGTGFPGGWKLLPGYNAITGEVDDPGAGDWVSRPVNTYETHGTHVAGIAAARVNEARGIAGVAGGVRVLPVKALEAYLGSVMGTDFDVARGVTWATDYVPPASTGLGGAVKVRVINMSLGGPGYSQVLQDAITYAVERGVVPVAAMGNDYKSQVGYPAAMQGVIAVGAVDSRDRKADFSTPGPHISLAAPGVDVYSDLYLGGQVPHTYGRMSGTSMATPFVAGAAALALTRWPELAATPQLTAARVKWQLESTARQIPSTIYPNSETGAGILDLGEALTTLNTGGGYGRLTVTVHDADLAPSDPGYPVWLADVIVVDDSGSSPRTVASGRTDANGRAVFAALPAGAAGTTYRLYASTPRGNSAPVPVTVTPGGSVAADIPLSVGASDSFSVSMAWAGATRFDLYVAEPAPSGTFHSDDTPLLETTNGGFTPAASSIAYALKKAHQAGDYTIGYGYQGTEAPAVALTATRTGLLPASPAGVETEVGRVFIQDPLAPAPDTPPPGGNSVNGEPADPLVVRVSWPSDVPATVKLLVYEPDGTKTGIGVGLGSDDWLEFQLDDDATPGEYRLAVEVQASEPIPLTLTLTRRADPRLSNGQEDPIWNFKNLFAVSILD